MSNNKNNNSIPHSKRSSECISNRREVFKSDIDSCVNGNQWLFSSYGPFKDSQNFPNFIEDLSFEEVRAQYYESKSNGTLLTYTEHYKSQIYTVKRKLQEFYRMDGPTWNALIDVYNNLPNKTSVTTTTTPASTNVAVPPTTSITSTATPNSQINNNIFGSSGFNFTNNNINPNPNNNNNPNIFGGTTSVAVATQQPNNGGNIFGNSIFGGGGNNQQILNAPAAAIFGGNPIDNTVVQEQQQQQQPPATNIFGNNSFGTGQIGNIQNNNAATVGNIFGGGSAGGGGNIFGANTFAQNQQQNNIFGANAPNTFNTNNNVFGGGQVQTIAQQQQPTNNIFGQTQPQPIPFQQNNLFANVNAPNVFGSTQQPHQQQQIPFENDQQSTMNMFESNVEQQSNQFSSTTNTTIPATITAQSIFGNNNVQQQQQQSQPAPAEASQTIYSNPSTLSPEMLASFKAETFEMGKIPVQPPPLELCR